MSDQPRANTKSALKDELEALYPASLAWALGCCDWKKEEAEEVLQATYLKVLDGKAVFEGRSSVKTWLFSVIRLTALERRRRGWVQGVVLNKLKTSDPEPSATTTGAHETIEESQTRVKVRDALSKIAKRQREVLELVFYHEITIEEAASVMGVSVGTARTHYDRGKKELSKILAKEGGRP